ncbi:MAG: PAS domain S-box protein [Anaerolineales bacterium]|nr:PAS domain S-box protein [Anaerolineales bacterium]
MTQNTPLHDDELSESPFPAASSELEAQESNKPTFSVIGIGTSAGGLEVLKLFFDNVPPDFEHTFVIVQHLSPDYKSLMADLLSKNTRLPIYEVTNDMEVQAGSIYLIPPGKNMTLQNNQLLLTDKPKGQILNLPINIFFESLAQERRENSVGIILSGTGSDGSRGVRTIKEAGGLVIVQRPDTAAFDGMPISAIATGLADMVLAPEQIPDELQRYLNTPRANLFDELALSAEDQFAFSQILRLLKQQTDLDFSWYKRPTLLRRMQRRLTINNCDNLEGYLRFIQKAPEEAFILYREFLIGVTHFFRDPEAWRILESEVLPKLVRDKQANQPFKVWVVGCSSGEEAYTIAILLQEALNRNKRRIDLKIFATDVEKEHLDRGAQGLYSESIVADISLPRLQTFFLKKGDNYQVHPDLRRSIIFSQHNALSDPPFGRMDLVICRNFMIYLQPEIQQRLLDTLHYALNKHGVLFLGPSESLGALKPVFEEINGRWRLYRNKEIARSLGHPRHLNDLYQSIGMGQRQQRKRVEIHMAEALNQALLKELGAACVYVDGAFNILHAIGKYKDFLALPDEEFSTNLLDMAPDSLKLALTTAVHKASRLDEQVSITDTWKKSAEDELKKVHLLVSPFDLPVGGGQCHLILFMPGPLADAMSFQTVDLSVIDRDAEQTKALELALKESQANLQAALEEAQTTNEELQATNEELMAANEELQSTNEELQSVNEELHTVNAEYQLKIDELAALNADIDNLLSSTQIGTIFLDRNRRIRRFTNAIKSQFDLLSSDIGRPLDHLAGKFREEDQTIMQEHIIDVLAGGKPKEREIQTRDGRFFLKRIYPFINSAHEIGGVVLTFVNITQLKQAQERIIQSDKLLKHTEQTAHVGSWEMDIATGDSLWSDEFFRICGFEPEAFEPTADKGFQIIHLDDRERASQAIEEAINSGAPYSIEKRIVRPDGEIRHVLSRGEIILGSDGKPEKIRGSFTDITERKRTEIALEASERQFSIFFHNTPTGMSITAPDGKLLNINDAFANMLGYTVEEMLALNFADLTHPDDVDDSWTLIQTLINGQKNTMSLEKRYFTKQGGLIWASVSTLLHRDEAGEPAYFLTTITDITQAKKRQEIQARFESIFNSTIDIVTVVDRQFTYRAANSQALHYINKSQEEIIDHSVVEVMGQAYFDRSKAYFDLCLHEKKTSRFQVLFDFPNLGKRYMDITFSPVHRGGDIVSEVLVSARDITEIKEKEDQLSATLRELAQSNANLEQFAYAASHDLQEPLNTIANYTGLLAEEYSTNLDDTGKFIIQTANDSALRMKEMIAGLLSYSRLRRGGLSFKKFNFSKLQKTVLIDLEAKLAETDAEVTFEGDATIYADQTQLRTVLQNLLINGMKYHHPGQKPQIQVRLIDEPSRWLFAIQDNGIGIAAKDQKIIFEIFRKLHTVDEYPGTGLGLAISQQIVTLHGGKIWCESEVGQGATFYFTLSKQPEEQNYD